MNDTNKRWIKRKPDLSKKIRKIFPIRLPFGLYTELKWYESNRKFLVIRKDVQSYRRPFLRLLYFWTFRELRWFEDERTFLIISRSLLGRKIIEMVYRLEDGDKCRIGQYKKTILSQRNLSPAWLYIERKGEQYPLDDYLLTGSRLQILEVRDFLAESVMQSELFDKNGSWSLAWDDLDCEPYIYGGVDGGFRNPNGDLMIRDQHEGFK
tara:strand:+ start:1050 stop:1676 length:627 start_codon:yes stop_codon:yes gene_type:complete